jgi:methylaspartate mutase epsilon subunit
MDTTIRSKKLSQEEFFKLRKEVLAEWPAGKDVNLEEAIAYHKSRPLAKNLGWRYADARAKGEILITSMSGVAGLEPMIELHRYLQDEGHSDILRVEEDTLTKIHAYAEAGKAVEDANKTGKNTLNGFPIVAHGVAGCRKLCEATKIPVTADGSVIDQRLICEIAFAGGMTGTTSGPVSCFAQYAKEVPFDTIIRNYQYVDRLMGYYEENGVQMMYRPAGSVEGPHSLQFADIIIENLIAAEQGVMSMINMPHQHTGNICQDVAAAIVARELCEEYMKKLGYKGRKVYMQPHHPYGKFPLDHAQIYAIISVAPVLAALTNADSFMTFTIDEAWTTPTKENNAASLRFVRMMYNLWKIQAHQLDMTNHPIVKEEAEELRIETRAILDRVLDLGDGDIAKGAVRAFETGELDVEATLCTTKFAKAAVLQVRDINGARRYLDTGNLPFTKEMKEFHRLKIAERSKKQGRQVDYETVIADWSAMSWGELVSGPDWQEKQAAAQKANSF